MRSFRIMGSSVEGAKLAPDVADVNGGGGLMGGDSFRLNEVGDGSGGVSLEDVIRREVLVGGVCGVCGVRDDCGVMMVKALDVAIELASSSSVVIMALVLMVLIECTIPNVLWFVPSQLYRVIPLLLIILYRVL